MERIVLEHVTKRYRGRAGRAAIALAGLDLRVGRGECLGVVGPNGAGKSTILGLLMGYLRPSSGTVRIEGMPPGEWVRRHGAGYLPEEASLPFRLGVRRALVRLAALDGLRGRERARRVEVALAAVGLEEQAGRRIGTLSRGCRRRVEIAQLLLRPRSMVLLDEPTSGLDPVWRARFRELVGRLRAGGGEERTVILCSHDLHEVERLADRVAVVLGGRLRASIDVRLPGAGEPAAGWLERRVEELLDAPGEDA